MIYLFGFSNKLLTLNSIEVFDFTSNIFLFDFNLKKGIVFSIVKYFILFKD